MSHQKSTAEVEGENLETGSEEREPVETPVHHSLFSRIVIELLVLGVRGYQITLGPFLGGRCRFEPSCSYYFIGAVRKHGPLRGTVKGIWRICRCQPFCPGGYDPP